MLAAEADIERLLNPLLQFRQSAVRPFLQQTQQLRFNRGRYSAHNSMTALRDTFHLLVAQSLPGDLFCPVIADREHLC
jgi:hypothetical protein